MYGQDTIGVQSRSVAGTKSEYEIDPVEVNLINQDYEPCISEKDKVKDLWKCLTDHFYSKLNCTLPWVAEVTKKDVHLCSSPKEYDLYHAMTIRAMYQNSEYIEKVAKCIPGCKRMEYTSKLLYQTKDPTLTDKWILRIHFYRDKFPVKEQFYIYGIPNLIADFGGYLGLLLGYSLLGFYDSLTDFFDYMCTKCKQHYHAKK